MSHPLSYHRIPLWAIVVTALSLCIFLGSQFASYEDAIARNGDIGSYRRIAVSMNSIRSGIEVLPPSYYPPLANILFLSIENNVFSIPFHRALALLIVCTFLLTCAFVHAFIDDQAYRWMMIAIPLSVALLEPAVFFARYDFFPMVAILLACLSQRSRLFHLSGFFLGIGCMLKLAPFFLVPLFFILTPKDRRSSWTLGLFISIAATLACSALILGFSQAIASVTGFMALRTSFPPYALSSASSIDLFLRMLGGKKGEITWMPPDFGHFNTGLSVDLSTLLLVLALGGSLWIMWWIQGSGSKNPPILLSASAILLWILSTTPLLTMHYYLWVLPLMILWFLEESEKRKSLHPWHLSVGILAVLIGLLGQWTYPHLYFDLVDRLTPLSITVNAVRNLLVLLGVFACLKAGQEQSKTA